MIGNLMKWVWNLTKLDLDPNYMDLKPYKMGPEHYIKWVWNLIERVTECYSHYWNFE